VFVKSLNKEFKLGHINELRSFLMKVDIRHLAKLIFSSLLYLQINILKIEHLISILVIKTEPNETFKSWLTILNHSK